MAEPSFTTIDPEQIDTRFGGYSISWPPESPLLEESVARVGLIHPPLLERRMGKHVVVCGLRRVKAAIRAGLKRIDCRIVEEGEISGKELFLLNLEDNLSVRDPSLLERARAVRLIARMQPDEREFIVARAGKRLSLPRNAREKERLLALDAMPEPVKEFIHNRRLPARLALDIADLGAGDAACLVALATRFGLSAGATGECTVLLREIMLRDGKTFEQVSTEAAEVIDPDDAKGVQARDRFLERVRELRFPAWKGMEREVLACLDVINGIDGIQVSPPPCLEGDSYRIQLVFGSCGELSERAQALLRFAESRAAQRALELLSGS